MVKKIFFRNIGNIAHSLSDGNSVRHRDLYLTTHTQKNTHTHTQETNIHALTRIRTRNPNNERPQTHALDCAATGIGTALSSLRILIDTYWISS
jgi:hypothetical protein